MVNNILWRVLTGKKTIQSDAVRGFLTSLRGCILNVKTSLNVGDPSPEPLPKGALPRLPPSRLRSGDAAQRGRRVPDLQVRNLSQISIFSVKSFMLECTHCTVRTKEGIGLETESRSLNFSRHRLYERQSREGGERRRRRQRQTALLPLLLPMPKSPLPKKAEEREGERHLSQFSSFFFRPPSQKRRAPPFFLPHPEKWGRKREEKAGG